ncbi:unnamed protein product [Caenorhabditis nigoni]
MKDEWKPVPQIAGFFSRESEKRQKNLTRIPRSDGQVESYLNSEEEHDDAAWTRYLKDETTWTVAMSFGTLQLRMDNPFLCTQCLLCKLNLF